MAFSESDRQWIEEVHGVISLPDPLEWTGIVQRINDLSDHTLISALKRGKKLDFGLRNKQIRLTQESLNGAGIHLHIRSAKMYIDLATHKSRCAEGPLYRDQRQFGARDGEQPVVDQIRQLLMEGNSQRAIARLLHRKRIFPRKGKWSNDMIASVIEHAERGRNRCACRMFRTDWVKPRKWSICWHVLQLNERVFEAMLSAGGIHQETTMKDINTFRKCRLVQPIYSLPPVENSRNSVTFLNRVVYGNCFDLVPQLEDDSISTVITSPPYVQQRDYYECVPEHEYPRRMVELMTAIRPKLKENGSVFIVIQSQITNGCVSGYVYRTILAVRDAGWVQPGQIIWFKPDGWPLGAANRPHRNWEHILWFSKTNHPYMDLKACGQPSKRIGMPTANRHGIAKGINALGDGTARVSDVVIACSGKVDHGIEHPAVFPPDLIRQLIRTYAPPGSVIFDPFVGSGTTCLVAQSEDYDFIGFDNGRSATGELYADMANRRLRTEEKYARGKAKGDRQKKMRSIGVTRDRK